MAKLGDSVGRYCYKTPHNHSLVFTDITDTSEDAWTIEPNKHRRSGES
jgi:hypothetical protein